MNEGVLRATPGVLLGNYRGNQTTGVSMKVLNETVQNTGGKIQFSNSLVALDMKSVYEMRVAN